MSIIISRCVKFYFLRQMTTMFMRIRRLTAFEVKARLYELEAALPGYFVRVSRSAIASILHIYSIRRA
jgi:DNA-binding LytR/AlgR family response regulator